MCVKGLKIEKSEIIRRRYSKLTYNIFLWEVTFESFVTQSTYYSKIRLI